MAILSWEPVYGAPNFTVSFKLFAVACDVGVGDVLLKKDSSGFEKVISSGYQSVEGNRLVGFPSRSPNISVKSPTIKPCVPIFVFVSGCLL